MPSTAWDSNLGVRHAWILATGMAVRHPVGLYGGVRYYYRCQGENDNIILLSGTGYSMEVNAGKYQIPSKLVDDDDDEYDDEISHLRLFV